MSTVRVVKDKDYSVINNTVLNDLRLTWKAKGLAAYLLSKPDNWCIVREHLEKQSADGISSVRSALQELEQYGYLVRTRRQNAKGLFEWEQVLYEQPIPVKAKHPSAENPPVDKPPTDKPPMEKPPVENITLVNTDVTNTDLPITEGGREQPTGQSIKPAPALLNSQQQLPPATAQQPATPKITVKAAQPLTPSSAAPLSPSASSGQAPAWQPLLSEVMTKRDIAAAERDRVEAALNGSADLSRRNRPTFRSPHVKAALNAAGYVAPGAGVTPVEIYYERFSAYQPDERLSAPQEYDLMTLSGQAGVRPAIEAYGRTGYKPRNVALIIEWTLDPSKYKQRGTSNGNTSVSGKQKQDVQIEPSAPVAPTGSIFREPEPGEYN